MTNPTTPDDLRAGSGWARFGLGFGVVLSVTGNVAHTVLAASTVSLWLRIPFAVAWPLALFVAVEIFVRVRWNRSVLHWIGRFLLIGPVSAVAAIVSYLHLHRLMNLADEPGVAAIIGPIALDGLMIGSTVALLAIRAMLTRAAEQPPAVGTPWLDPEGLTTALAIQDAAAPVSPAAPTAPRAGRPRAAKSEQERAVRLLLERVELADVVEQTGVSLGTVRTYAAAMRILRDNPAADLSDGKVQGRSVNAELIAIIRNWANREGRVL